MVKFLPLLRRESFRVILFMNARWIAAVIVATVATMPDGLRGVSTVRTSTAGLLLSHSNKVSTEPVEQAIERFVGLDCHDLRGGRLTCHHVLHPPLKP